MGIFYLRGLIVYNSFLFLVIQNGNGNSLVVIRLSLLVHLHLGHSTSL